MVTGCALHSEQAGVGSWRDRLFGWVIPFVGRSLLFLPGYPAKYPEVLCVAVVLPELMRALHGRFATALVAPDAEQPVNARRLRALARRAGDALVHEPGADASGRLRAGV